MVEFKNGQLVQIYRNKIVLKLGTECKLMPLWSPPCRVTEHLLNSYRLKTLEGVPLDGLFNARCLRGFSPREGMELATQQKMVEEWLTSQGSEAEGPMVTEVTALLDGGSKETPDDDSEELDVGDAGLEDLEMNVQGREEDWNEAGFFYEDEEDKMQEKEDLGIGVRVAVRRRGCLHNGGGQME